MTKFGDWDPDFSDLAACPRIIRVVPGLSREIEGDGKTGLTLGQIRSVQLVGGACG